MRHRFFVNLKTTIQQTTIVIYEAPLNDPHDSFIKAGLGEPGQMASFLKAYLLTSLTAAVDWTSLEVKSTDFLDEQLHHRHADLLFSARFGEKPIFFHLLFEHQKSVDSCTTWPCASR